MAMRGPVIACLVASLLVAPACTTRQRVAGGGAGLAVIGLGLTYSNDYRSEEEIGTQGKVGIAMVLTGLVVLFVAAALEESSTESKPREIKVSSATPAAPRVDPRVVEAQKRRDQAATLTKQAQDAARAGDCAKVTELSAQVGALDPAFYGDVFMKDEPIQRCFVPAAQPPAEPAPPLPPAVIPTTPTAPIAPAPAAPTAPAPTAPAPTAPAPAGPAPVTP